MIVVQYHGGVEYADAPTDMVQDRLRAAIDHGADLVIAHHPHVLQGMEIYHGKLIAYSMGNFLFDQYRQETQNSALLYVWMDGATFHRAEIVPIYVKDYHTVPATGAMRDYVLRRLADLSVGYGEVLDTSGGHGVIRVPGESPDEQLVDAGASETLELDEQTVTHLPTRWHDRPPAIEPLQPDFTYRPWQRLAVVWRLRATRLVRLAGRQLGVLEQRLRHHRRGLAERALCPGAGPGRRRPAIHSGTKVLLARVRRRQVFIAGRLCHLDRPGRTERVPRLLADRHEPRAGHQIAARHLLTERSRS